MPVFEKVAAAIAASATLAIGGWIYATSNRVTALEAAAQSVSNSVTKIEQDVRDLRNLMLEPRGRRDNSR